MRNFLLLAPLAVLTACAPDVEGACTAWIEAANVCAGEYAESEGVDPADYELPASACDTFAGSTDAESADLLNCQAAAYADADCTTADGYSAAGTAVSACISG